MSARPSAPPAPRPLLAALAMAAAGPAPALEVEALEVRSVIGQPLHARARITGAGSALPLRTAVRCLEGACDALRLRTYIAGRGNEAPAVVLRSFSPLRAGVLRLELEVGNGSETTRRAFSLEPEAAGDRRRTATGTATVPAPATTLATPASTGPAHRSPRATATPVPAAPGPAHAGSGTEAWVVQPGQTLSGIAAGLSRQHGGGTRAWMERLFAANSDAFIRGDRNRIRAGATLRFDLPRATATHAPAAPAPAPLPRPAAPDLAAPAPSAPVPSVAAAGNGVAATRETLAGPADDGRALAARLARLEARIRTLQAELAGREAAIERLRIGAVAHAAESPLATATDVPAEPPGAAASNPAPGEAAARDGAEDGARVGAASTSAQGEASTAPVGSDSGATPATTAPSVASAEAGPADVASPVPAPAPVPTSTPAAAPIDWTLIAATGLVALVLGLVLLLRSLSRRAHASSRPLRRDDRTLKEQIRDRIEAAEKASGPDLFTEADEGIDLHRVPEGSAAAPMDETVRLGAPSSPPASGPAPATVNEDEIVTEVDVKIVYGLFDGAETVLIEALESAPASARLLLKLAEVRFYRRDAEALARLASEVLAQGQRQPAWLWAKIERLGRELCPERAPFTQSPTRPGLRSVG